MDRYDSPDPIRLPPAVDGQRRYYRADLDFHEVDHSGLSYEGRVFLNNPDADAATATDDSSYAGSFFIFGHWGCVGDDHGHCAVPEGPLHAFDRRQPPQLLPIKQTVDVTEALTRLVEEPEVDEVTVHVVPIAAPLYPDDDTSDLLHFSRLSLVTYDGPLGLAGLGAE